MGEYLIWVEEQLIKDLGIVCANDEDWERVMNYVTSHDLSHSKYSIDNYLAEVK